MMAKPYPDTFERESSSPLPTSGSSQTPISFQSNVNRQKTKKWANAPPADYGGDDWGDEYNDNQPSPPIYKVTGLRQPGQVAKPAPAIDKNKRIHGELPPLPPDASPISPARNRPNSFLPNDEQRAFSNVYTEQAATAISMATRQASHMVSNTAIPSQTSQSPLPHSLRVTTQPPVSSGLRKVTAQLSPPAEAECPQPLSKVAPTGEAHVGIYPKHSALGTDPTNLKNREDYLPSAVPPPLQTRPAAESSSRFPARKTSVSQPIQPEMPDNTQSTREVAPKPWAEVRSSSPGASARPPTSPAKTHPLIRPADIYRRLEEESSKRLAPVLESVKEGKSEYGFDDYEPALVEKASKGVEAEDRHQYGTAQLSPIEDSRYSSSPKLPDLNRISGFGMDLFSKPIPDETYVTNPSSNPVIHTQLSETPDSSFGTEPSLGFKSAVQHAFDTSREIPVTETPISPSGSGVRRTDSESTSTTGISPIMSRVPSVAVADNLARQWERRDNSTPVIAELDEPDSRRASAYMPTDPPSRKSTPKSYDNEQQHLQQGNHRDIMTQSASNSPAKTPNLETNGKFPAGETAHISEVSDTLMTPPNEKILQPPIPEAGGEQGLRPGFPGGWVSYGTTASGSIIESQHGDKTRSKTPVEPVSPVDEEDSGDNNVELIPTATNLSLSQFAINSVATAGAGDVTTTILATDESGSVRSPATSQSPTTVPANSVLPPPYPMIALHAVVPVDPRIPTGNELEQSKALSHLTTPADLSEPLHPLPINSPSREFSVDESDSIPPATPLKKGSPNEMAASESIPPVMSAEILPTLSTNTSPQDEESDRLRREIVKSFGPIASGTEGKQLLAPSRSLEASRGLHEENVSSTERESTYLPSEYDNYWASTVELEVGEYGQQKSAERPSSIKLEGPSVFSSFVGPSVSPREGTGGMLVIAPLKAKRVDKAADGVQPSQSPSRFSWEAGLEQVSAKVTRTKIELEQPNPVPAPLTATLDTQTRQAEESRKAYVEHGPVEPATSAPLHKLSLVKRPQSKTNNMASSEIGRQVESSPNQISNEDRNRRSAPLTDTIDVAASPITYASQAGNHSDLERRPSVAREKIPANISVQNISRLPEDEHPASSRQPFSSRLNTGPSPLSASLSDSHTTVLTTPQQVLDLTKVMQFKDIVALPHPYQRIRTFNETRYQFAAMDTGLGSWLQNICGQLELSTGSLEGSSANTVNNTARSKGRKTGGPPLPALQQPYYQQYLNASPSASTPVSSRPGTDGITSGSQQGFSPSNSKLSTQQMQSKGKDLLHSAGILGGKASKAGKGLLSKGKNRFRGSGSGDKTSSPHSAASSTKLKSNERRNSEGALSLSSLALSRTSGQDDSASQHSEDQAPTHQPRARNRSRSLPVQKPTIAVEGVLSLWEAPVSAESSPSIRRASPHVTNTDGPQASLEVMGSHGSPEEGGRDTLGMPAPIGKTQPSWDPTNATPIVEEGFQYDERPSISLQVNASTPGRSMALPPLADSSRGSRSYSAGAAYYDTPEKPTEIDDWVMVSKKDGIEQPGEISGVRAPQIVAITFSQPVQPTNPPVVQNSPPNIPESTPVAPLSSPAFQIVAPNRPESAQATASAPFRNALAINAQSGRVTPDMRVQNTLPHDQVLHSVDPVISYPSFPARPDSSRSGPSTFFHNSALFRNTPISGPGKVEPAFRRTSNLAPVLPQYSGHPPLQSSSTWSPHMAGQENSSPTPPKGGIRGFLRHIPRRSKDNTPTGSPKLTKNIKLKGTPTPSSQLDSPQATWGGNPRGTYTPSMPSGSPEVTGTGQIEYHQLNSVSASRQSFVGLPPIRRSSTFGLGFSPRLSRARYPIDDEHIEEVPQRPFSIVPTPQDIRAPYGRISEGQSALGFAEPSASGARELNQRMPARYSFQETTSSAAPEILHRPAVIQASPTEYRLVGADEVSPISASPPSNQVSPQGFPVGHRSGDLWRPNQDALQGNTPQASRSQQPQLETLRNTLPADHQSRPSFDSQISTLLGDHLSQPSFDSQISMPLRGHQSRPPFDSLDSHRGMPRPSHQRQPSLGVQQSQSQASKPRRSSYEGQHIRSPSSSGHGYNSAIPTQFTGTTPAPSRNAPKHQHQRSLEQPPSSAQRYPELFKAEQPGDQKLLDEGELPAHYFQAPLSREEAFLPRQQTNEYQLPGVGPPRDEPQPGNSGRNSGLFKEIGGRLSRTTSRDRGSTRDEDAHVPNRPVESRGNDTSEASITSEDTIEKKTGRSGLLGPLTRTSTGGVTLPRANESMVARPQGSPLASPDKKRIFFSGSQPSATQQKEKPNKLPRASTRGLPEQAPKKKRFSNLTGMFSRGNVEQDRDSATEKAQALPENSRAPYPTVSQSSGMPAQSSQSQPGFVQPGSSAIHNSGAHSQEPTTAKLPPNLQSFQQTPIPSRLGQPQQSLQNLVYHQQQIAASFSPVDMGVPENPESFQRQTRDTSATPQDSQRPAPNTQNPPSYQRRSPPLVTHVAMLTKNPDQVRQNYQQTIVFRNPNQFSEAPFQSQQQPPFQPQQQPPIQPQQQTPIQPQQQTPFQPQKQPPFQPQQQPPFQPQQQSQQQLRPAERLPPAQNSPVGKGQQSVQSAAAAHKMQPLQNPQAFQNPQPTPAPQNYVQDPPLVASARQSLLPPSQLQPDTQHLPRQLSDSVVPTSRIPTPSEPPNPMVSKDSQRSIVTSQPALSGSNGLATKHSHSLQPRTEKKPRHSAARLLSGLIGGRRSTDQQERKSTHSRSDSVTPPQSVSSQQQQSVLSRDELGVSQESGHQLTKEQIYVTPPIPGAYHLVRGEGAQLAPTSYDPRGLNIRFGPQNDPSLMYQYPNHAFPPQSLHLHGQPHTQTPHVSPFYQPNGSQPAVLAPSDSNISRGQVAGSPPHPSAPRQASRPLSSEDLMARSPARRPLGQQAPYQLTLPQSPANDDPWDRQLSTNRNPVEREPARGRQPNIDNSLQRNIPAQRGTTATISMTASQRLIHPALRQSNNPGNGPLLDERGLPVKPPIDYAPPAPNLSSNQLSVHPQGLDRSTASHTQANEISQISGPNSLNVPGVQRDRAPSITPPSPSITPQISPERSPERVDRRLSPRSRAEEDIYSASPRSSSRSRTLPIPRVAVQETSDEKAEEAGLSENKARPSEFQGKVANPMDPRTMPPEKKIVSQEEKILADEVFLNVEDEVATMSATSYPGQEWHPHMNGYEDWD